MAAKISRAGTDFGRLAWRKRPRAEAYAASETARRCHPPMCWGFWFWRRARASHLAIIGGVDLANCCRFRLGLAHPFEPGSIVSQEPLRVWRQVIEATELGHHKPCGKIRLSFGAGFSGD